MGSTIHQSTNAYVYSAGLYSWFTHYDRAACLENEDCQEDLIDISYSEGPWLYNLFTKGAVNVVIPEGGLSPVKQMDTQSGFTTEINVYLAFAQQGGDIDGDKNNKNDSNTPDDVGIVALPCTTVAAKSTFIMSTECTDGILGLPTSGPKASQNNDPAGTPEECHEMCDFFRLLTGTCCGSGGSIGNPIVIPENVTIPYVISSPV